MLACLREQVYFRLQHPGGVVSGDTEVGACVCILNIVNTACGVGAAWPWALRSPLVESSGVDSCPWACCSWKVILEAPAPFVWA